MSRVLDDIQSYIYVVYRSSGCVFDYAKLGKSRMNRISRFFAWLWVYHLKCLMMAHQWGYWLDVKENNENQV